MAMTEKEAWLEIGERCMPRAFIYLCNEAAKYPMFPSMCEHLLRFKPLTTDEHYGGNVWWQDYGNPTDCWGNSYRATACCFLAAMYEEEE